MPFVFNPSDDSSQTGNDIIEKVLDYFLSGQKEEKNKLAATAGAGATTISFQYELGAIRSGSEVEAGLEVYYVWEVDQAGKSATVEPGQRATITAIHSTGTICRVNPKLTKRAIFDALNAEIRALSAPGSGLFCPMGLEFSYSSPISSYDLEDTGDILDVLSVTQEEIGATGDWHHIDGWRLDRKANSTDFPSGNALYLPAGFPGRTVRVVYAAPFAAIDSINDNLYLDSEGNPKAGGIPPSMHDILVYGTLMRLGPVREIKRNFTEAQGDARRAQEVPPGSVANSYAEVRRIYNRRVNEEVGRLSRLFPDTSKR